MKREALEQLVLWKNKAEKKPLIIRGARQVGKTWLMKEFGRLYYEQTAYINFEKSKNLKEIFRQDFNIQNIILALNIETRQTIHPENTLLIFDEIQEVSEVITSLKYFNENAPEYDILCAGSLLGVMLHQHTSFPVGKVDFLDLNPMNFEEYLMAVNENELADLLFSKKWDLIKSFKEKFIRLLKQYYFVGGMPEVVNIFIKNADFYAVKEAQKRILTAYLQDFSKHAPYEIVPRIRMLWNSIPAQLAKENRKFIYGIIKTGARAKDYELALNWLIDCGLVHKVNLINKPAIPLIAYQEISAFKLYIVDVGLLTAMGDIDAKTIIEGNSIFEEFKGALTEQFVCQQLISSEKSNIYYWTSETSRAEVDFIIQKGGKVIPLEVKAEENLQAKSLKVYYQKYKPEISVRTSMSDYREDDWLTNVPLYAVRSYFMD